MPSTYSMPSVSGPVVRIIHAATDESTIFLVASTWPTIGTHHRTIASNAAAACFSESCAIEYELTAKVMTKLKLINVRKPRRKRKNELLGLCPYICPVLYNVDVKRIIFLTALLSLPTLAIASQAGFPSQPIWVSSSYAVEGETVTVSAIVANDATSSLWGTLVFLANGARIGARAFELPSGESQIHSIEWKPKKGEYRLAAKIEGTSAELIERETPAISVTVKEPPAPPSKIQRAITQAIQTGSTLASSSAPVIIQAARTIFAQTEALRSAGTKHLENYLASNTTNANTRPEGAIAGTSTRSTSSGQASNTAGFDSASKNGKGGFSNIAQTVATSALFAMKNAALFYPLLALVILGTLYFLARRIRRKPSE